MNSEDYGQELKQRAAYTEKLLLKYLPPKEGLQKRMIDAMEYSCMAGGKRLRPIIMQETFFVCGGTTSDSCIEAFMAAMEMIHTYSLVHDDLPCMDNDEYRRGKRTTWSVYGDDFGVLCGDALLNYAFETASGTFLQPCDPARVGKALHVLAVKAGIHGMLGGQAVDVWLTDKPMHVDELDFIYRLKTGALIEASMMIGAILAGADAQTVTLAERIAAKVGLAFQIRDDILDVTSTTEVLGKPVRSDERNNKSTYVSLYGLEKAHEDVRSLMCEAERMLEELPGDTGFLHYIFELLVNREK